MASPKILNSINNLRIPGTGTGAFPERLGSSGTLKIPQTSITAKGMNTAKTTEGHPSI